MRHRSKLICLLLFITLGLGGWGSVLAAAFCPHAGSSMPEPAAMMQNHSCCHAKLARQQEHCETASDHDAMSGMQMPVEETPVEEASGGIANQVESALITLPACEQCFVNSAPLPAPVSLREQSQNKRASDSIATDTQRSPAPYQTTFALPVLKRQGAPPGTSTRGHILNSIFLI